MKAHGSRVVAVGVSLLFVGAARAQETEQRVKMRDLPAAVQKTVRDESQGARLRGLAKEIEDGKIFYEAELVVGGHHRDVLMDESGAVVEIEETVALASLPAAVKAEIEKQAGGGRISVVESITKNGAVTAYEAHVRRGGKSREIKVAPDGTPLTDDKE